MAKSTIAKILQDQSDRLLLCRLKAHRSEDIVEKTVCFLMCLEAVLESLTPIPDEEQDEQATVDEELAAGLREFSEKFLYKNTIAVSGPTALQPADVVAGWAGMRALLFEKGDEGLEDIVVADTSSFTEVALAVRSWIPKAIAYRTNRPYRMKTYVTFQNGNCASRQQLSPPATVFQW